MKSLKRAAATPRRLIPGVPVTVVGNGVDLGYFRSAGEAKKPASMVFTGVMDYRPKIDAVVWFCNEILPIVQTEIRRRILRSAAAGLPRRCAAWPNVAV